MKRKKSSLGCLFWIALILLILVIFLFNKKTIDSVLESTGFLNIIGRNSTEPEVERTEDGRSGTGQPGRETGAERPQTAPPVTPPPARPETPREAEKPPQTVVEVRVPEEQPAVSNTDDSSTTANQPPPGAQIRRSRLYFVNVDPQGAISLKAVVRPVYFTNSPLTETLNTLIKGLSASELNEGLLSLIPDGTKLNSATVRDGLAYLDFSDDFLFNSFGTEGYAAQLQQVVYTTLEFSNVQGVQILINGKKQEYMSIEGGIYIGQPLTKASF